MTIGSRFLGEPRRAGAPMLLACAVAWVALLPVGCSNRSTGVVIVVDRTGKPVDGATVTPIAASVSGAPNLTNAAGEAHIDTPRQAPPTAVSVSKGGFVAQQAAVSDRWPLRITLPRIADVP